MREAYNHRDHLKLGSDLLEHRDLSLRGNVLQAPGRRGDHRARHRLNAAKRGKTLANEVRKRRKIHRERLGWKFLVVILRKQMSWPVFNHRMYRRRFHLRVASRIVRVQGAPVSCVYWSG